VPGQIRDYADAYGTPQDRMFLLPPGMNPSCRRPPEPEAEAIRAKIRGKLDAAPGDVAVLHISNSVFNKGTDRTIAALGALPEDTKKSIRLWIVGKLRESELTPAVEAAGLSAQTRILGQVDGVSDLMFAADLFLHPARNEATGTTLIEAIAAGLPVLTTDACGFATYVREATGTVLDGPYSRESAVRMLEDMIPHLDDLKRRTLEYAKTQDFCSRAKVFADIMEKR
jgi:UDP-glucose:(heptosyl)LPS alpha-1,3-glucosyltransferase